MKILHINCNYIGTALHQIMLEHLDGLGVSSTVYVPTYSKETSIIEPNEYVVVSECFKKMDRIWYGYKQKKIIKDIMNQIQIDDFDLIHAYTLFTDGNCAMKISQKYDIPYVVAIRDTDINTFLKYRPYLESKAIEIMRNASAVFFLSTAYKEVMFKKYIPQKYHESIGTKTYIIPNGIDDFWQENIFNGSISDRINRVSNRTLKVVYAGRINKRKNLEISQKAIQLLRDSGWKIQYTFTGKIENKQIFDRVMRYPDTEYLGVSNKEKLLAIYRNADLFLMPSYTETFGLVYAEALSQGLPVIYTKGQGFDGQFEEGTVGYRTSSNSAEECADAIEKIANNYDNISKNCVPCAEKFKWNLICKRYMRVYFHISAQCE